MTTTTRLIAACTALIISLAAFAVPANAKSMVQRNKPHRHMMHHRMMHHHMMHHRGMMHHKAM